MRDPLSPICYAFWSPSLYAENTGSPLAWIEALGSAPRFSSVSAIAYRFNCTACWSAMPHINGASSPLSIDIRASTTLSIVFNYAAQDGNLQGGHVQLSRVYSSGDTETHTFSIPAQATVTGTTSGQVRVGGCPRYNESSSSLETIWLYDANNHMSNSLTMTVTRPAGAP